MTAEEFSVIVDFVGAACNVLVVALAVWGLRSWRNDLRVSSRIDATEKARVLYLAAGRYVKEILTIRSRKVTNSEIRAGLARLDDDFQYKPQKPQYYIELVDTLGSELWEASDAAFLAIRRPFTKEVQELVIAGRTFQREFHKFHGTMAVLIPYMIPDSPSVREVAAMKDIAYAPKEGPDQFSDWIFQKHRTLIEALTPYLHIENEQKG